MAQNDMENLTKEARMTYISADFIEQTEEQLHAAETEIRDNMDKMKDMSPVERFRVEWGIYDRYIVS
jgi:hypothetical protein